MGTDYKQDAQLSQSDPAAGCVIVLAKMEDWNWETIFYGHYEYIFNHCDIIGLKICQIGRKTQNTGYYSVQGHPRSSKSVPIESPYAISSYWLIVTDIYILSRTVSELSQHIVEISDSCIFQPPFGGLIGDYVRSSSWADWKARSGVTIYVPTKRCVLHIVMLLRNTIAMGTRGNRIQLYITMGTVFSAFCDGGPLRWRPFAMADRNHSCDVVRVTNIDSGSGNV